MQLTPQQRLYVRKRTAYHDPDPSEMAGELNIVPFLDIVVNIIMFLLMTTQAVLAIAELDAHLPSLGRRVGNTQLDSGSTLNLSVQITRAGLIVFASGGKLAPGCRDTAQGRVVTVPSTNGQLVWSRSTRGRRRHEVGPTALALTECVRQVKQQYPEETQVILSADPEIEFEHLVGAMDALRGPSPDPLFPDVLLSAGQR
jgi:biopolymer transport protein TolR